MRVLLVKTSSLGDLIHSFPALTDARRAIDGLEFHWMVEEAFAEVPSWHPAVSRTVPIALRRWRRNWRRSWRNGELSGFRRNVQSVEYQLVLDAQGLLVKSAIPAALAHGPVAGFDRSSAREPLASAFYRYKYRVSRDLHAIERVRQLFSLALGYPLPDAPPDYGIRTPFIASAADSRKLVFLHATTWPTKHWPENYWSELIALASGAGFRVLLPWNSPEERLRAERLLRESGAGELMPRMSLTELKTEMAAAAGVVGLDSGLTHIAAAVGTPAVALYGPTRLGLTGALGSRQRNLAAEFSCAPCMQRECSYSGERRVNPPCFSSLPPATVWSALKQQIVEAQR